MKSHIESLPDELLTLISDHLVKELRFPICRRLYMIFSGISTWQNKLKMDFGLDTGVLKTVLEHLKPKSELDPHSEKSVDYQLIYIRLDLIRTYQSQDAIPLEKSIPYNQQAALFFPRRDTWLDQLTGSEPVATFKLLQHLFPCTPTQKTLNKVINSENWDLLFYLLHQQQEFKIALDLDTLKTNDEALAKNFTGNLENLLNSYYFYIYTPALPKEDAAALAPSKKDFNNLHHFTAFLIGVVGIQKYLLQYVSENKYEMYVTVFFSLAPHYFERLYHYYLSNPASPLNEDQKLKLRTFADNLSEKTFIKDYCQYPAIKETAEKLKTPIDQQNMEHARSFNRSPR